jgi:diamine N-acetyltransferase
MVVTLRELTDANRPAVLALRMAPQQARFAGGAVHGALRDASQYPQAKAAATAPRPVGRWPGWSGPRGASELLTSYVPQEGGPAGFYRRLGFAPTGELDTNGEVIVRLLLA